MKKIIGIISALSITLLAACTSGGQMNARAVVSVTETTTTSISYRVEVRDTQEELSEDDGITLRLYHNTTIIEERTNISLSIGEQRTFVFNDLERETDYYIRVFGSINGSERQLYTNQNSPTTTKAQGDIEQDPLLITTIDEFKGMSNTKHYRLANDLDFDGESIQPLFTSGSPFAGTFDGDGYTIKNIHIHESSHVNRSFLSVFGSVSSGKIENTIFEQIIIDNTANPYRWNSYIAIVASRSTRNEFVLNNVTIKDSQIIAEHNVSNTTDNRNLYIGLAIGSAQGSITDLTIENSSIEVKQGAVNGNTSGTTSATTGTHIGGAVGLFEQERGLNIGRIHVEASIDVTIDQHQAAIDRGLLFVGGVIGAYRSDRVLSGVYAEVDINLTHNGHEDTGELLDIVYVAGLVGYIQQTQITDAYYKGEIDVTLSKPVGSMNLSASVAYTTRTATRLAVDVDMILTVSTEDAQSNLRSGLYIYRQVGSWHPSQGISYIHADVALDGETQSYDEFTQLEASDLSSYFNHAWLSEYFS